MVYSYDILFANGEQGEKECLIPSNVSMLKVEVVGGGSLNCTAMLDRDSNKQAVGAIKASDFTKVSSMTEGIYTIECSGFYKCFFTLAGNATVYLKAIC